MSTKIDFNNCVILPKEINKNKNVFINALIADYHIPKYLANTVLNKIFLAAGNDKSMDKAKNLYEIRQNDVFSKVVEDKYHLSSRSHTINNAIAEDSGDNTKKLTSFAIKTNDKDTANNFANTIKELKRTYGDNLVELKKTGLIMIKNISREDVDALTERFTVRNGTNPVYPAYWLVGNPEDQSGVYFREQKSKDDIYNIAFPNLEYDESYTEKGDNLNIDKGIKKIERNKYATEEEKENAKQAYLIDNATKIICSESIESSLGMNNLAEHFTDMNKLSYLASTASSYVSLYINYITEGNADVLQYFELNGRLTRKQVLSSPDLVNKIIKAVEGIFVNRYNTLLEESSQGEDIPSEVLEDMKTACDNFPQLITLGNRQLLSNEGITLSINGEAEEALDENSLGRDDSDESAAEDNAQDENAQQLQDKNGFKLSNPNVSISQKISTEIKVMLSLLTDDSRDNLYGYGFKSFVDVPKVSVKLLNMLSDCYSYSDMEARLSSIQNLYPWVKQLLDRLNVQSAEAEILRTKFFRSMRKEFYKANVTYTEVMPDGTIRTVRKEINTDTGRKKLIDSVILKFDPDSKNALHFGENGIKVLDNKSAIYSLYSDIVQHYNTTSETADKRNTRINDEVKCLVKYLDYVGIKIDDKDLRFAINDDATADISSLSFDNSKFKAIFDAISFITSFKKDVENLTVITDSNLKKQMIESPFKRYPKIAKFTPLITRYENLIDLLFSTNSILGREPVFFVGGKSNYSFNNPSTIGTMVKRLKEAKTNPQRFREFMDSHFNSPFFIKGHDRNNNPIYYSQWLNDFAYGRDKSRDVFDVTYKMAFNEESYEKMSDRSTALSIYSDFYADNSKFAYYRPLISSDKPKNVGIRYKKLNYFDKFGRDELENSATDAFVQELNRAKRVANAALSLSDEQKIAYYDITLPENIKQKMANKERVTAKDVTKDIEVNGKIIDKDYIFAESGASFHFNAFLNNEIIKGTKLGNDIINYIFNTDVITEEKFTNLKKDFLTALSADIDAKTEDVLEEYKKLGLLDVIERKVTDPESMIETSDIKYKYLYNIIDRNHPGEASFKNGKQFINEAFAEEHADEPNYFLNQDTQSLSSFGIQRYYLERDVKNFVFNNYIAKINIQQLFGGDPAFYGGTSLYQKRNSQQTSSGELLDKEATIHGKRVSDGKFRIITISEAPGISTAYANIEHSLNLRIQELEESGLKEEADNFRKQKDGILSKFRKIAVSDGQAFTSLSAIRKKKASLGEWTRSENKEDDSVDAPVPVNTDEAVYQRIIHRKALASDFEHTFTEPLKGFTSTTVNITRNGEKLLIPTQHKNSEYMLSSYLAFMMAEETGKNTKKSDKLKKQFNSSNALTGLLRFMEESARDKNGDYAITGVDTVNFPSGEKVGSTQVITIDPNSSAEEVYQTLKEHCYNEKTGDYSDAVRSYNMDDFKIQQVVPEEFKGHKQPQGTQERQISLSNIASGTKLTIRGKESTIENVRERYNSLISRKIELYVNRFQSRFEVVATAYGINSAGRKQALSYVLKEALGNNQKYSADLKLALSVVNGDFIGSLDDESLGKNVENMVMSLVRSALYREKIPGGPVVQSTCWSNSDKYNIRYYYLNNASDKNEKPSAALLDTKKMFFDKNNDKSDEENERGYKKYCEEHQGAACYYETSVPLPNKIRNLLVNKDTDEIDEKYIDLDTMELNFDAIKNRMVEVWGKENAEKALEGISYRIPTEARYSIQNIKIVHFSSNWSGSSIVFPQDITCTTGSDFDIDKSFIMLRDMGDSTSTRVNKDAAEESKINDELFDIQAAAMRVGATELESFSPGDFSDMSDYSCYLYLLQYSNYDTDVLDYLYAHDTSTLRKLTSKVENVDIMNPVTDIILHRKNMQPLDIIGMAAVANINHDMVNMCGSINNESGISQKISKEHGFTIVEDIPEFMTTVDKDGNVRTKTENDVTINVNNDAADALTQLKIDSTYGFNHALITGQLCKYIGASADAVKDPALARLNVTPYTFTVIETLVRWGFSNQLALAFIAQPAIRDLVSIYESELSNDNYNSEHAIDKAEYKVAADYKLSDDFINDSIRAFSIDNEGTAKNRLVKYSDLINRIKWERNGNKAVSTSNSENEKRLNNAKLDLIYLEMFRLICQENRHLKSACSYLRYNSVNAADQKTYIELMDKLRQIEEAKDILSDEKTSHFTGLWDDNETKPFLFERKYPFIQSIIDAQEQAAELLIQNNMNSYGDFYGNSATLLPRKFSSVKYKTKMKYQMKNYLLTRGYTENGKDYPPVVDLGNEKVRKFYKSDFPRECRKLFLNVLTEHSDIYSRYIETNSFIQALTTEPVYREVATRTSTGIESNFELSGYTIVSNVNGLGADERQRIMNDWGNLLHLNTGNAEIDNKFKKLAINMAIYFMYRDNGFEYGPKSPLHLLPLSVKLAIPGYMKALKSKEFFAPNPEDENEFTTEFVLNNMHDGTYFPELDDADFSQLITAANGKITVLNPATGKEEIYDSSNINALMESQASDGRITFDYNTLINSNKKNNIAKYITFGGENGTTMFLNSIFKKKNTNSQLAIVFEKYDYQKKVEKLKDFKKINANRTEVTKVGIDNNYTVLFHIVNVMGQQGDYLEYRQNYNPNSLMKERLSDRFNEETEFETNIFYNISKDQKEFTDTQKAVMQNSSIIEMAAQEFINQGAIKDVNIDGKISYSFTDEAVAEAMNKMVKKIVPNFTSVHLTALDDKENINYKIEYIKRLIEEKIIEKNLC
jgi:hypothetical protein